MISYRIRGQVKTPNNDGLRETTKSIWVQLWSKDNDHPLGYGTTDPQGWFEIQFTNPEELPVNTEVFFQVFLGQDIAGTSESSISLDTLRSSPQIGNCLAVQPTNIDIVLPRQYTIVQLNIEILPEQKRTPQKYAQYPPIDTVIDVLPTLDQVSESGLSSKSFTVTDDRSGSLQQIVDNALGQVLGHSLKAGDPQLLKASLLEAFTPQANNGRTQYVWTPRSYATVQTELGGTLTGAQASLYHRAKAALNEILPLLNQLYPLDAAVETQNIEAARAIVRTEITELVNEMGTQGGPRAHRVETLFQMLIGDVQPNEAERVAGQIRDLAATFGLTRFRVNTVDDEQNYSNFLIIRDYIVSLRASWKAYMDNSGEGAFVGPQLVLLSQALSVVAESVQETYRIMDLVFLGPAERQAVWINFTQARDPELTKPEYEGKYGDIAFLLPNGDGYSIERTIKLVPPMTVEALLSWTWQAATTEWPILAKEGGKLGIAKTIADTAERLVILIQAASYVPIRNHAFRRAGVLRALRDLAFQVYQVEQLARQLIPPSLDGRDGRLALNKAL